MSLNNLNAQISDSAKILKPQPSLRFNTTDLFVPEALMLAGIGSNSNHAEAIKMELREERNEHLPVFHTKVDNYLQFSPFVIVYALDGAAVKSGNDCVNRTAILLRHLPQPPSARIVL